MNKAKRIIFKRMALVLRIILSTADQALRRYQRVMIRLNKTSLPDIVTKFAEHFQGNSHSDQPHLS